MRCCRFPRICTAQPEICLQWSLQPGPAALRWASRALPALWCHWNAPSHPSPPYQFTAGTHACHVQTGLGWDLSRERNTGDSTYHVTRAAAFPGAHGEIGSMVQACSNNVPPPRNNPCSYLLGGKKKRKNKIDYLILKRSIILQQKPNLYNQDGM